MEFQEQMSSQDIEKRVIEIDRELSCGVTESKAVWLCYEMNSLIEIIRRRQYESEIGIDDDFFNKLMGE